MIPKNFTVTSKAAQTGASNILNLRSTSDSSPNANINTKSVTEIYAKMTPLPQQAVVALPIPVEHVEKSASQKRSTTSTTNFSHVMFIVKSGTISIEEQLEALNHALHEKDSQIAYLMNRLKSMTEKSKGDQSLSSNQEDIIQDLKDLTLLVIDLVSPKVFKSPLKGLARPSKSSIVELGLLPARRTSGFDPNVYKLLAKAGYCFDDVAKLTKDFKKGEQSSIGICKVWKEKNTTNQRSKVGLGY
ncbi:hypothetical protein JCGZ_09981 [Jatropha curcas]|uniref:Uncharacterized protein n=1 Tax=Jatropha curcas TaxID=180498 RepID=A0A067KUQ9_JATCU|nr:hypothetical protein JCGZ_09981 [Jatropha curcas]